MWASRSKGQSAPFKAAMRLLLIDNGRTAISPAATSPAAQLPGNDCVQSDHERNAKSPGRSQVHQTDCDGDSTSTISEMDFSSATLLRAGDQRTRDHCHEVDRQHPPRVMSLVRRVSTAASYRKRRCHVRQLACSNDLPNGGPAVSVPFRGSADNQPDNCVGCSV